jgi:chorismate synthase
MNSFGRIFRVSIYGESHGTGAGIVIDGCPPGVALTEADFNEDLSRRKSGKKGTTPRLEADEPKILNGVYNGFTTGAPLHIHFDNTNTRSRDYEQFKAVPRPGHADFVADKKYDGFEDPRGGGHFSGRITLGIVAAGVVAKKILGDTKVNAELIEVMGSKDIEKVIEEMADSGDSVGGVVECIVENVPVGLGEPFFDSTESMISHMMFSIPATRGIEFGSGFETVKMKGSEHNDCFIDANGKTETNYAGGINGGITNGNNVVFKVAVKPTSSISKAQNTMNMKTKEMTILEVEGRHDACIAIRIPVVIEAATAIVMADLKLTASKFKI